MIKKLTGAEVVSGMAHITGGGITENLPRILPKGMGAVVDRASWTVPPLFEHLRQLGNVEEDEMMRTFNMGIGLIAVVPAEKIKKAKAILNRANERHCLIGRVVRGSERSAPLRRPSRMMQGVVIRSKCGVRRCAQNDDFGKRVQRVATCL